MGPRGEPGPPGESSLLRVLSWDNGERSLHSDNQVGTIPGLAEVDPETEIITFAAYTSLTFQGDWPNTGNLVELPAVVVSLSGHPVEGYAALTGDGQVRFVNLRGFYVFAVVLVFRRPEAP